MHEVAHQLSFNCGLLNRDGDVSLWLAEGLATYCEATENGGWQGLGEPNTERLRVLWTLVKNPQQKRVPLRELIVSDAWRDANNGQMGLMGYAQSWALFKMLMDERPQQMKKYLERLTPGRLHRGVRR
jgi:hypothetical protein